MDIGHDISHLKNGVFKRVSIHLGSAGGRPSGRRREAGQMAVPSGKLGILTQLPTRSAIRPLKSQRPQTQSIAVKSTLVTYLLWLFGGFGVLGLHRFYLGRWLTGLLWLFTGGIFLVGAILDLFLIPPMVQVENLSRQLLLEANRSPHPPRPA
jgi:hypothetical protein